MHTNMHTRRAGGGAYLRLLVAGWIVALACAGIPFRAQAAGVVGNGTAASCTESALANAILAGPGTITFSCGANPVTIVLSNFLEIGSNITIDGGSKITLSGAGRTLIFQVFAGRTFILRNIVLTRGRHAAAGAIENFGTTTIVNSVIKNSTSTGNGGAIHNYGSLTLTTSTLTSNLANKGGALYNDGGTVTLSRSHILNNMALEDGGGIYSIGTRVTLNTATISANRATGQFSKGGGIMIAGGNLVTTILMLRSNDADQGGGLYVEAGSTATIRQAEISGNSAGDGAGIATNGAPISLRNSTLSGNQADFRGGGLYVESGNSSGINLTFSGNSASSGGAIHSIEGNVTLKNTIVTRSITGRNCAGSTPISSLGFNISSDATCNLTQLSDRPSTNPLLGPLANNGGPSLSYMPSGSSPAIDKGNNCPAPDQRGFARVSGPACDIGAIEVGSS